MMLKGENQGCVETGERRGEGGKERETRGKLKLRGNWYECAIREGAWVGKGA